MFLRVGYAEHVALYLHRDGLFAERCPEVLHKLVIAMASQPATARNEPGAHGASSAVDLCVRCVELHSYAVGGALLAPLHRDTGSTLTMSVGLPQV
jgi:hypothetical protein